MADIFISYKREEQPIAKKLADELQKKGWTVWWDPEIRAGERFDDVIEKALIESKCVVVLWSKLSVESQNVKDEATYALNRDKLVPILIEEVNLPFRFERINTGQLIDWDGSDSFLGYQKLIADVSSIIGEPPVEEQKRVEAARKAEEERKREEEEQKRVEAGRRAEEKHEHKDAGAKPKLGAEKFSEPKLTEPIVPEPRKRGKALKFSAAATVIVLLIAGIWLWVSRQQVNEVRQEIENLDKQALKLENAVAEIENHEQFKKLYEQTDTLSHQAGALSKQATKVGLESQLEQIQDRLKQIQIQLADKEKEFIEVRQEIEKLNRQTLNLENEIAKLDKPEQIEGLYEQRDTLSHQVEGFVEKAAKVGLESQLEQLQDRLKQVQIQLANKEKELIAARKGRIFVESVPDGATIKILNIEQGFQQGMELEPGRYHVQVSSEGYEPQDRWIDLGPGDEKQINFELGKIVQKVARLHVETAPENATVRILNIKPKFFQGMELESGRYHLEVASKGYETQIRWIDLVAGNKEPFRFELAKIKVAEPPSPQKLGAGIIITKGPPSPQNVITNSIGMKFVLIPAGSFTMGSQLSPEEVARKYGGDAGYYKDEQPQHPVEITKPFYLQTTEVSQGHWKRVMGNNPSHFKDCGDDCPVESVSWVEAQEFISELNQMERTHKYRLPTEAEWEYACRAGAETTTFFITGECISPDHANYDGNYPGKNCPKGEYREKTVKVGSFQPNAWGLYNMHGNVREWCQDWYGNYPSNSVPDPKGPDKGKGRVLRGGSWGSNAWSLRSAGRSGRHPGNRDNNFGFRVARDF